MFQYYLLLYTDEELDTESDTSTSSSSTASTDSNTEDDDDSSDDNDDNQFVFSSADCGNDLVMNDSHNGNDTNETRGTHDCTNHHHHCNRGNHKW